MKNHHPLDIADHSFQILKIIEYYHRRTSNYLCVTPTNISCKIVCLDVIIHNSCNYQLASITRNDLKCLQGLLIYDLITIYIIISIPTYGRLYSPQSLKPTGPRFNIILNAKTSKGLPRLDQLQPLKRLKPTKTRRPAMGREPSPDTIFCNGQGD